MARDDSSEWPVWQHAIRTLEAVEGSHKIEVFVCISPTSPLRAVEDVDACLQTLQEGDADLVYAVKVASRNPYYNMVVLNEEGYARLAIQSQNTIHRRQDAPQVYDETTIAYAARPEYIMNAGSFFEGKVKAIIVPAERAPRHRHRAGLQNGRVFVEPFVAGPDMMRQFRRKYLVQEAI